MPWPLSQDYNEAIQSPTQCFADPELRQGEAVTNELGLPAPRSGNFADVYALVTGQRKWAVKCFTRQIPGLQERYQQISQHLEHVKLPFMVDFTFLERGIKVRGDWYPILKMQWVEGLTLNQFVKSNLDKPHLLDVLCQLWVKLATRLREANIAHCDLQHGNVLLVAGGRAGKLSVKLVDYDGMCVPSLTLLKSIEVGHPAYQHPQRQREGIYSLEVDRFSHLAIYTALRALMYGGKPLWDKHDDGDNLLFKPSDYAAPTKSKLFYEMLKSPINEVIELVHVMMEAVAGQLEQAPLLEQVAASVAREGLAPIPTTAWQHDRPRLGILMETTNGVGPDAIALGAVDLDTMGETGDLIVRVKRKTNLKRTSSTEGKRTKWPMALGLGAVGSLLAVLGALWAGGVFGVPTKDGVQVRVARLDKTPVPVIPVAKDAVVAGKRLYLSDLKELESRVGYGQFGNNGIFLDGRDISVNDVKSMKGLATHPPKDGDASVTYSLDGLNAITFETKVAINDSSEGPASPLTFVVLGDGVVLWRSEPIQAWRQTQACKVDVKKVHVLELRVNCPGPNFWAHAVWLDPVLVQAVVRKNKPTD